MNRIRKRDGTTEHRYVEERLSAYLDGQLTPREHNAVRQHLTTCQECQWNLSTLQQTVQWTGALPNIPAPRVFTIPAPAQTIPASRRRLGFVPLLQGATALVALLLVFMLTGDWAERDFGIPVLVKLPSGDLVRNESVTREGSEARYRFSTGLDAPQQWVTVRYPFYGERRIVLSEKGSWEDE